MRAIQMMILHVTVFAVLALPLQANAETMLYFLRHAEVDMSDPDKPLLESGKERAKALARHFSSTKVSHILVTNYHRTLDTAKPLAAAKGVEIIQVPKIGSKISGQAVTNTSRGKVAIKPMLVALNELPDGSVAMIVANSGNLYPIMSKYGVSELPCASKKCFPKKEFNNIWAVTKSDAGTSLRTEKYGGR